MKSNKNKEKKKYEKISATESLSSLSNVFTKAEIDAEIDAKIDNLITASTAKNFVLDELASYAINNMNDVNPSDSAVSTVKVCANSSALNSLSLSQRRTCYLY